MSLHHRMMLQRYGLGAPNDLYSQVNADPIFTPLFLAAGFSGVGILGTSITAAGIASAIATTSLTYGAQIR